MTRNTAIEKLIERLRKADGPSSELDDKIFAALWRSPHFPTHHLPYTASIDAAMLLVPKEWVGQIFFGIEMSQVRLWAVETTNCYGEGATPAIALCIAALNARMS